MGDWLNGWTLSGAGTSLAAVLLTAWRRSINNGQADSLGPRLARWASAIGRLQIAEGDLDYIKRSRAAGLVEIKRLELELDRYEDRNLRLSRELRECRSSAQTNMSPLYNDGYTRRVGAKARKKPTTSETSQ